ncbi:unnamed protein product [Trifolium pratense]|uniref:Uncharacterized protein n=1 Tax=Trifolium pratense TaxID=57577 RepID=A0ACB0L623_TRIPR|nr:unnamed protein product [Trifolium pratense]
MFSLYAKATAGASEFHAKDQIVDKAAPTRFETLDKLHKESFKGSYEMTRRRRLPSGRAPRSTDADNADSTDADRNHNY